MSATKPGITNNLAGLPVHQMPQKQEKILTEFKTELTAELTNILAYWMEYTIDYTNGGFYGSVDNANNPRKFTPKGAVMNARILWAFSAAYNQTKQQQLLTVAKRAFQYINYFFRNKAYGGVYWSVNEYGKILDGRNQIYALAFCIYGMSEYYAATGEKSALDFAKDLYRLIEKHSYDSINGGYFEAFGKDWSEMDDLRLSKKDANEKKTMNTHLHIIEAYSNLYKVWPDKKLEQRIVELLEIFDTHIINKNTFHLKLFFDEYWKEKPDVISFGHDIEAAWLLQQCAQTIGHNAWINRMKENAVSIANAALNGLDKDGGLWYEYNPQIKHLIKEKHSWPQAEAVVGFFNAWQLTGNDKYLQLALSSWRFIRQYIKDNTNGEWFWGINQDYTIMENQDKAGFWKCPYHNTRCCLEIINRSGRCG